MTFHAPQPVNFSASLVRIFLAAVLLAALPVSARAQCDDWITTPGHHAPFRAVGAQALTLYTPPGVTNPRVILGGQDVYLNGFDIGGIGQFDGTNWLPLGNGVDATVMDTLVWNSPTGPILVASGNFRNAGGSPANYLAAWNGSTWSQIGGGVHETSGGWVSAMTVWDPDGTGPQVPNLVVAGNFDRAGTVECQNIARWDGTTWRTFGIGLNNWVDALTTWAPDGAGPAPAQLIAAGHFTVANNLIVNHVARWDGVGWRRMGDGLSNAPNRATYADALTTWDPDGPGPLNAEVVVVGGFSHADGVPAHGIAAWNGSSWRGFNTPQFTSPSGVGTWDPDASGPQFPQLVVSGNVLDATGTSRIDTPAIWNGTTFQTLGTFADTRWASRFATWDPDNAGPIAPRLVAAGLIFGNVPTGAGQGIVQLVGNEWTTLNPTPNVLATATFGSRVVVGGQFHMIAVDPESPFSSLDAANLAAWDGYEVTSFGNVSGTVRALKSSVNNAIFPPQRDLFVAGTFGGVAAPGTVGFTVNNIARFSEGARDRGGETLPPSWFAMGQGFNSSVHALERFNSATYAGGSFTLSGTTAVNRVARFDGTNWQPLNIGIATGTVHALRVFNGSLYAGGTFTIAGGITTGGLARWNGSAWSAVGGVFSGSVFALAVHNNELIIGGQFGAAIPTSPGSTALLSQASAAAVPTRRFALSLSAPMATCTPAATSPQCLASPPTASPAGTAPHGAPSAAGSTGRFSRSRPSATRSTPAGPLAKPVAESWPRPPGAATPSMASRGSRGNPAPQGCASDETPSCSRRSHRATFRSRLNGGTTACPSRSAQGRGVRSSSTPVSAFASATPSRRTRVPTTSPPPMKAAARSPAAWAPSRSAAATSTATAE